MLVAVLAAVLVVAALFIGRAIIRNNYYVAEYHGTVSIMRGIQGSLLGMPLHEPYLLGCLNARNDLSQISYGQSLDHLDCHLMKLEDLRPSERAQVQAGLPTGSLDGAITQLRELAANSLLPPCPPPRATSPPESPPGPLTPTTASGTPNRASHPRQHPQPPLPPPGPHPPLPEAPAPTTRALRRQRPRHRQRHRRP